VNKSELKSGNLDNSTPFFSQTMHFDYMFYSTHNSLQTYEG